MNYPGEVTRRRCKKSSSFAYIENTMSAKLEDFFYVVPSQNDPDVQIELARRSDLAHLRGQPRPREIARGNFYSHQQVVHLLMKMYDRLLVAHPTGTGKTCSVTGIAEYFKRHYDPWSTDFAGQYLYQKVVNIRRVYILVTGPGLVDEFKKQIVCVCSRPGAYSGTTKNKTTRELSTFYTIEGYAAFYNHYVAGKTDEELRETFANTLVVIDEVHNIVPNDMVLNPADEPSPARGGQPELQDIYLGLRHLFEVVKNCKVMLLSATPMINQAEEIAPVMNLILPPERRMPLDRNLNYVSPDDLLFYFRGYVSYVPKIEERVVVEEKGIAESIEMEMDGQNYSVEYHYYPSYMQGDQLEGYSAVVDEGDTFSRRAQQASIFIYPPVVNGGELSYQDITGILHDDARRDALVQDFFTDLDTLKNYGAKLATMMRLVAEAPHNVFIFSQFLDTGVAVVEMALQGQGYNKFDDKRNIMAPQGRAYCTPAAAELPPGLVPARRYAVISSQQSRDFQRILDLFNHPANRNGDYIKVVVASPVGREGINLHNVTQIHILSAEWNEGKVHQAINRAIRINSFEDLEENPVRVEIYRHAAINKARLDRALMDGEPIEDIVSVDLRLYERAAEKQLRIERVMRYLRQGAIDLYINDPLEGQVDLGVSPTVHLSDEVDTSQRARVLHMFTIRSKWSPQEMARRLAVDLYLTYQLLEDLVDGEVPVRDSLGIAGKLMRNDNVYYIEHNRDENRSLPGASYYTDHLRLVHRERPLDLLLQTVDRPVMPSEFREMGRTNPLRMMAYVEAVVAVFLGEQRRSDEYSAVVTNQWLMNHLFFFEDGSEYIVVHDLSKIFPSATTHGQYQRMKKAGPYQRILVQKEKLGWRDLTPREEATYQPVLVQRYEQLMAAGVGTSDRSKIRGRISADSSKFWINDITTVRPGMTDRRAVGMGRECSSWGDRPLIFKIAKLFVNRDVHDRPVYTGAALSFAGLIRDNNVRPGFTPEDIHRRILNTVDGQKLHPRDERQPYFDDQYIDELAGAWDLPISLCEELRSFFLANGLMEITPDL